jgi:histone acetyltransferase (RNA polymerase elongator complex component)
MIVPLFLPHYGCGRRCTYCNQEHITNSEKASSLEDRVARLLGTRSTPVEVALYGGNMLGLDRTRLEGLLRLFEPYRDRVAGVRISTKPVVPGMEVIGLLKKYGVRTIELGVPTFNDNILAALKRGHTADELFKAYRVLREEGFETGLQVMVGLPGETPRDIRETASAVTSLAPAFIRIYPLLVIQDTELYREFKSGRFSPDTVESAVAKTVFISITAWSHRIRTIKMGLTENDVLKEKIVAGPFHPAFGYLVKSEAFYLALLQNCAASSIRGAVRLAVHPSDVAHLTGHKGSNLAKANASGIFPTWEEDRTLEEGHFVIEARGKKVRGGLADALAMTPF